MACQLVIVTSSAGFSLGRIYLVGLFPLHLGVFLSVIVCMATCVLVRGSNCRLTCRPYWNVATFVLVRGSNCRVTCRPYWNVRWRVD